MIIASLYSRFLCGRIKFSEQKRGVHGKYCPSPKRVRNLSRKDMALVGASWKEAKSVPSIPVKPIDSGPAQRTGFSKLNGLLPKHLSP
jgi:hypothetical protein